jgi:osmotically-inducible protein OsmY
LGVTNDIALTKDVMLGDVADRINKALQRNAIIDDSRITVTATGNTVYFDGMVGSWNAMDEALDNAWAAPGVNDAVNRLGVIP